MNLEEIWRNSLRKIEGKVGSSVFELWFKPIKMASIKDQAVTLEIPNRFFKEWIEDSYPNLIKDSLEAVVSYPVTLKYRVEEKQDTTQQKIISQLENKRIRLANKGVYLNPKYTFENLITGK